MTKRQMAKLFPYEICMFARDTFHDDGWWGEKSNAFATEEQALAHLAGLDADRTARRWHWAAMAYGIRYQGTVIHQVWK